MHSRWTGSPQPNQHLHSGRPSEAQTRQTRISACLQAPYVCNLSAPAAGLPTVHSSPFDSCAGAASGLCALDPTQIKRRLLWPFFTCAAAILLLLCVALRGVGEIKRNFSFQGPKKQHSANHGTTGATLLLYSQEEGLTLAERELRERVKQSSNRGRKKEDC